MVRPRDLIYIIYVGNWSPITLHAVTRVVAGEYYADIARMAYYRPAVWWTALQRSVSERVKCRPDTAVCLTDSTTVVSVCGGGISYIGELFVSSFINANCLVHFKTYSCDVFQGLLQFWSILPSANLFTSQIASLMLNSCCSSTFWAKYLLE